MHKTEVLIYLSLGSNLGDRFRNLQSAGERIGEQVGEVVARSHIYESAPWGFRSERFFLNCCMSVSVTLDPLEVLDTLLSIERSMGRIRNQAGYSDRSIDTDLLFYGDVVLEHARLTIPHPQLEKRRFVLLPLSEIAPGLAHPVSGRSVAEMLTVCPDNGEVRLVR